MKNHQFQKNTGLIGLNFQITFSHLVLAIIEFTHLNKSRITYLLQQFKFLLVVITILFDQFVLWWLYWRWVVDFLTVNTINLFFGGMAIPIRMVTRETKMTNWKSKWYCPSKFMLSTEWRCKRNNCWANAAAKARNVSPLAVAAALGHAQSKTIAKKA